MTATRLRKPAKKPPKPPPPPRALPAFSLVRSDGEPFTNRALEGRFTLLFFGFTNCPDICPVHLAQIAETFDQIPQVAGSAEVIFVTVDPERDTPEALRTFLDNFDRRFVGLTGTFEELEEAQKAVGVPVAFAVEDEDGEYTVQHAGQVFAWAPDGLLYAQYPFGTRQSDWLNDIQILAEIPARET